MKNITVVHCWSAPRSRSTALLYSFDSRLDCIGIDEPLYRRWLESNKDTVSRPYTNELISGIPHERSKPSDRFKWERELQSLNERLGNAIDLLLMNQSNEHGVIFVKHMAKFYNHFDFSKDCEFGSNPLEYEGVNLEHKHVLLIRDPASMLASWNASSDVHNASATSNEIGIIHLLTIYSDIASRPKSNNNVVILDSDDLEQDPSVVLSQLCNELQIPFSEEMLHWNAGPRDCDGPWADWWYSNVHKSSGWSSDINRRYKTIDPSLLPVMRASLGPYNYLKNRTHRFLHRGPDSKDIYEDPRNENILVYIGSPGRGRILPRDFAGVSPFDSSVQGGDATWEGIRVYRGKILLLDKHLKRLFKSAKALGFQNMHTKEEIIESIFQVLAANGMRDGAHMRLTLTRGEKCTSSMNPNFNVYGTTLIILPEWKPTQGRTTYDNTKGISLITASTRRNSPSTCDSKIHHNNMINNILPKIQANLAGASDALMLDIDGFVSETNATNVFMVEDGILMTPHADHCLPGITRQTVLDLARDLGITTEVRRISLAEFHSADEVFTTGTMGELTPVTMIDGRTIGDGKRGAITSILQDAYSKLPEKAGYSTEIPPFT